MKLVHKQELYCYLHKCLNTELVKYLYTIFKFYLYVWYNMLGGSVHMVKENAEALVVAT